MTIADDRFIYDGLTRGQAILFLEQNGFDRKKLLRQSDDAIGTLYDIAKRKIPELSPADKFNLFSIAWTRVSARLDNMVCSGHNLDLLHQIEALLDKQKEDKLDTDVKEKTVKVFKHKGVSV